VWDEVSAEEARKVAPKVMPHAIDLVAHTILWPDTTLPAMLAVGALPIGRQERTEVFRPKYTDPEVSKETFAKGCRNYMEEMMKKPPPGNKQRKVVMELSTKEQEGGMLSEWYSKEQLDDMFGEGSWRALPRYAIQQGDKWRLIDNGKSAEHNLTYGAEETIHTTCTAAGAAAAASFKKHAKNAAGRSDFKMSIATQDMWKAYRQVPCHSSQSRYMVVMVWHDELGKWVFGLTAGLLFGITGAVLAFNRIPAFIVAVARRWLAIPAQNFFDDFRILDLEASKGSANRYFALLLERVLGWRIDPKKEQKPGPEAVFLGNRESYTPTKNPNAVVVAPKEGRAEAIAESVKTHLDTSKLSEGDAKTLRGRIIHFAGTCAGRVGKGILHHVNARACGVGAEWSKELDDNLHFVLELLKLKIPRQISLVR